MTTSTLLTDDEFLRQIREATLAAKSFDHLAHLRLAWILLQRYELPMATQHLTRDLQNYVRELGHEDRYHHTLTIIGMQIVHDCQQRTSSQSFQGFLREFPRLQKHFKSEVQAYYSFDIFNHPPARTQFIPPDRLVKD